MSTTNSNLQPMIDEALKEMRSLGAKEGVGSMSRADAALRLAEFARQGILDEDDAKDCYANYLDGLRSVGMSKGSASPKASLVDSSTKVQESKFRQILKVGALPLLADEFDTAAQLLKRATEVALTLRGNDDIKVKSPFDAMLDVARAQLEQPETKLTDEQLSAIVVKPGKKEKDELEKLAAAYKAAYKLARDLPLPGTNAAVEAYRDAIVEAGGEVPAMTKEEKAEAQAMAFLRTRGMIAVGALPSPIVAQ